MTVDGVAELVDRAHRLLRQQGIPYGPGATYRNGDLTIDGSCSSPALAIALIDHQSGIWVQVAGSTDVGHLWKHTPVLVRPALDAIRRIQVLEDLGRVAE